jgi:metal-sulfur cluster biosynthetic enzyme/rhodanese-related sulfurtransferase
MGPVLVAVVLVALGAVGWWLARRVRRLEVELIGLRALRHDVERARTDVERGLGVTRAHLAAVVAGEAPSRTAILRGAAHEDIAPQDAVALLERRPDVVVLDVRTEAEYAREHIPNARLIPVDELEDRLDELPPHETLMLVHCAAGGRSTAACEILAAHGFTRLLNLTGGMHSWPGPRTSEPTPPPPAGTPSGTAVEYRGGPVTGDQVVAAIRDCYDPEIPLNVYDLGLIYGIDIDEGAIAVRMTLTSEGCPSARAIPEDVKQRIVALGQPNVTVDVVFDPPWHPSRISDEGKQKLGLT